MSYTIKVNGRLHEAEVDGDMPLHRAVREGRSEIVSLLLEYGSGKEHKNLEGLTPRQLADK